MDHKNIVLSDENIHFTINENDKQIFVSDVIIAIHWFYFLDYASIEKHYLEF